MIVVLPAEAQDEEGGKPKAVDTGNDPRNFGSKFMPYYRYTELKTEFQPVYDWEAEHFSFWFAPEFGKAFLPSKGIFRNGGAIYIKPGFGVDPDRFAGDREFTVELGIRFFFSGGRDKYDMMTTGGR